MEKKPGILQKIVGWNYKRESDLLLDIVDINRSTIRKFIKNAAANTPRGLFVLDAGAGEGYWRNLFAHTHYRTQDNCTGYTGCDYSHLDYNCDITNIPVDDSSFDVILLTEVLEHLSEPFLALKELNRILKKGGYLYLTAPQGWEEHLSPHDYYRYTQYGLRYLLEKANFRVDKVEKRGGYFKYIAYRMWHIILMPFLNREIIFKKIAGRLTQMVLIFFLVPVSIICYYVDDIFDKDKRLTLGYQLIAVKK
jgi:ubiquinone/menaquinone biosynthesis C-methylase UbiE